MNKTVLTILALDQWKLGPFSCSQGKSESVSALLPRAVKGDLKLVESDKFNEMQSLKEYDYTKNREALDLCSPGLRYMSSSALT